MGAAERSNPFAQWKKEGGGQEYEVYDMFGRQVSVGDIILLGESHTQWRVVETAPILTAGAPRGAVRMTLAAGMVEAFQGGVPQPGVTKVRDVSEYMSAENLEAMKKELAELRAGGGGLPKAGSALVDPTLPPERPEGEPSGPKLVLP